MSNRNSSLCYVYMITCKINNKKYIGATRRNVADRWHDYINAYHRGYGSINQPNNEEGSLLYDMLKYNLTEFTFEILEIVQLHELFQKETYYIRKFNTKNEGYNNIESESENGGGDSILELGKETRFIKGSIPHNAIPLKGINLKNDYIIEFNSYNEATRYLIERFPYDCENLTFNQILYRIHHATQSNQNFLDFKWYKEGTTNLDYIKKPREYKVIKFLIGEKYKNNKGYEFEIIEILKNNKRRIKFTETEYETISDTKEIANGSIKDWESPTVCNVGIVGKEIDKPQSHPLYDKWRDMLRRCYGKKKSKTKNKVIDRWFRFSNFIEDILLLENGNNLLQNKKGYRIKLNQECNIYSKDTVHIEKIKMGRKDI